MPRWRSAIVTASLLGFTGLLAHADPPRAEQRIRFATQSSGASSSDASARPRARVGSTVAIDEQGLWVAERVPGVLLRTDLDGRLLSGTNLHPGLGQLLLDPARDALYVADRGGDRVLRFVASATGQPTIAGELAIREPYGLALSADGASLLVTSIADHQLVAIDTHAFEVRWRLELLPEPRAVAISPDGTRGIVGFLSSGVLADVELADRKVRWHALDPRDQIDSVTDEFDEPVLVSAEANSRFEVPNDIGRRHARNVFALDFVGDAIVAPHQLATPQIERRPRAQARHRYGGTEGFEPIEYRLARIDPPAKLGASAPSFADLQVDQPRALAHDPARDLLYVGGYGDDGLEVIGNASRALGGPSQSVSLDAGCGVDGLVPTPAGDGIWVHCELTRSLIRVALTPSGPQKSKTWLRSGELVASTRSPEVELGAELFRRNGDGRISDEGMLACANCHPEGRNDGLSWRLGRAILQTPMLAGRVVDTAPYKWTGEDTDLRASIRRTIERLGGDPTKLRRSELAALEAYMLSLAPPRPPTIRDPEALSRGRAVFEQECSGCHAGERSTDRSQHALGTTLDTVDTPSLIGLAHTAPYYHDGSAIDLRTLLDDRATIHDMTDTSALSEAQRQDLVAFLESL